MGVMIRTDAAKGEGGGVNTFPGTKNDQLENDLSRITSPIRQIHMSGKEIYRLQ